MFVWYKTRLFGGLDLSQTDVVPLWVRSPVSHQYLWQSPRYQGWTLPKRFTITHKHNEKPIDAIRGILSRDAASPPRRLRRRTLRPAVTQVHVPKSMKKTPIPAAHPCPNLVHRWPPGRNVFYAILWVTKKKISPAFKLISLKTQA